MSKESVLFSSGHESLRQIVKLRTELNVHLQLFKRLNIDDNLEYNIPNLVYLLEQKIASCERQMYAMEFKQTTLINNVEVANERTREIKNQYDELLPLVKTLTQQITQLNKEKGKLQQQYISIVNENVSLKRERDAAMHGVREKDHDLTLEKEKRQKLRSVYRVLNTSFNDSAPPDEVREALEHFQKTLMN